MSIHLLYEKISLKIHSDGSLNRQIQTALVRTVSDAFIQMMSSDQGYCFSFGIKQRDYTNLINLLGITESDLKDAYLKDWGSAALTNKMHSNQYYQLYLLMLYYGIKENDEKIITNSIICLLIRLWNGRKKKYIPFCDKDIMTYVVNYMTNKRHIINRFNNPLEMIQNYFVPTLLSKYRRNLGLGSGKGLKEFFEAAFTRIRQLFVFNPVVDMKTGQKTSTGGLRSLYMKAKEDGLSIKNINVYGDDDNPISFADYVSTNELDTLIDNTVKKIITNTNPKYTDMFINNLYNDYSVKIETIQHILVALHKPKYKDKLQDLYSIILQQTSVISKDNICNAKFTELVNKKVISSKNNKSSIQLKNIIQELLDDIMIGYLKVKPLSSHSSNHLIQLHKLVIRALIYNLRLTVCR